VKRGYFSAVGLIVASLSLLFAEEENTIILDAEQVDYSDGRLSLSGGVQVEHSLGWVSCREAVIVEASGGGKTTHISLYDEVDIRMWNGGHLTCGRADIDSAAMVGTFFAGSKHDYVTYSDVVDKGGGAAPLLLKSRRMTVHMAADPSEGASRNGINGIIAEYNVTVDYNHELMASADQLIYRKYGDEEMGSIVCLLPKGPRGVCQVATAAGDVVKARQIFIDNDEQRALFDHPVGAVYVASEGRGEDRIDFSSVLLAWDQLTDVLTLRDDVVLHHNALGTLTCEDTVRLCHHLDGGMRRLEWAETKGKTIFTYIDPVGKEHELTCYGTARVDPEKQMATLESPLNSAGEVDDARQVAFRDERGEIYADAVFLDFAVDDDQVTPAKLTIAGNVKVLNREALDPELDSTVLQFAVADVVEYIPETETMYMYGQEGRRVLFYDRINRVQVSAPAINVRRDAKTGKTSYEGVGDVRFTFIDHERDKLRYHFPAIADKLEPPGYRVEGALGSVERKEAPAR